MIQVAYGAIATVTLTVKNNDGSTASVVGWTARADVERFDDGSAWSVALALPNGSVANGGVAGTLTLTITGPQASGLSAAFGSPVPIRKARLSFYGTPPGGSETLLLQQLVDVLPTGAAVAPFSGLVAPQAFTVSVSALGGIIYSDATPALHGLMSATDKPNHDVMWLQEIIVSPSGDSSGVADQSSFDSALADVTRRTRISPGTYYVNGGAPNRLSVFDLNQRYGAGMVGPGATCAVINYVGPRIAGRRLIDLDNAINCQVRNISFNVGAIERVVSIQNILGQPTANVVADNHFAALNVIHSTSATSVTIGIGAKTFSVSAGLAATLVNGSTALAISRSTGAYVYGTVAYSGASLTLTVGDLKHTRGSGTYTDWDIRTPPEGVYCAADAECVVASNRFNYHYYSYWNDGGFGGLCIENFYSSFNMIGVPYHLGGSASECLIRGPNEPDLYGWSTAADIRDTLKCEVHINTGDNGAFGPIINVVNGKLDHVHGMFWDGPGNTSAAINATGTRGLRYGGVFATPYLIDFGSGSSNVNPRLDWYDTLGTGVIGVWKGSALSGAGYQVTDTDGRRWESSVRYDEAKIAFAKITALQNANGDPVIQTFALTLASGDSGAIAAIVRANSIVMVKRKTASGTALTVEYDAPAADRVNGAPGSFKAKAMLAAGTINTADNSAVECIVLTP